MKSDFNKLLNDIVLNIYDKNLIQVNLLIYVSHWSAICHTVLEFTWDNRIDLEGIGYYIVFSIVIFDLFKCIYFKYNLLVC